MFFLACIIQSIEETFVVSALEPFVRKWSYYSDITENLSCQGCGEGHFIRILFLQFFHLLYNEQHHKRNYRGQDEDEEG